MVVTCERDSLYCLQSIDQGKYISASHLHFSSSMASTIANRSNESIELRDLAAPSSAITSASLPENDIASSFDHPPEPHNVADIEDVPPNGGYGWVCTACVFSINAHTWGVNSVS